MGVGERGDSPADHWIGREKKKRKERGAICAAQAESINTCGGRKENEASKATFVPPTEGGGVAMASFSQESGKDSSFSSKEKRERKRGTVPSLTQG